MIDESKKGRIFDNFDSILSVYDLNPKDIFMLLNEYQNYRLEGIEKTNNDKLENALNRTILYSQDMVNKKFERVNNNNKKDMLYVLVNILVLSIDDTKKIKNSSILIKRVYDNLLSFSDTILNERERYLKLIPESRWFIKHLERLDVLEKG